MPIELPEQTEDNEAFELTDAQKRELDRRLESVKKNPGEGRTWEEIKAEFMRSRDVTDQI